MTVFRPDELQKRKRQLAHPIAGQRRPGASQQWIRNQLQGQDWTWGGKYQNRPGMADNLGLGRADLRQTLNSLAEQGMGRKGLNFLLNNQSAQSVLQNGTTGGVLGGVTPEMIRWMMQQGNQYQGGVDINSAQYPQLQGDFFNQFGGMRDTYLAGIPGQAPVRQAPPGPTPPNTPYDPNQPDVPFAQMQSGQPPLGYGSAQRMRRPGGFLNGLQLGPRNRQGARRPGGPRY